ncbi:MAG: LLM class F420-dependent oxidoreductase [Proteobacteria bacterium]|nr:LLM class F420-dependent oxidoreductase [Pseudomonadota bacterium]
MTQIAIGLYGAQQWFGGEFAPVGELARVAEEQGVDAISLTDHVVMGENLQNYPYGPFPAPLDFPWFEPLTVLAMLAGVTQRIRLSTGVLIAPLRPAVLLAKQLATLDVLSRGRVSIGLGVGWQKEEYDASGIPWEGRYTRLEEQIQVCRLLWSQAPADFSGSTVQFRRIHAWPRPQQPQGIPIWLGLAPSERNIERMARYADGWIPMEQDPQRLAPMIAALHAALRRHGRDPAQFTVRVVPRFVFSAGAPDLEATLAAVPDLVRAGATMIELFPSAFCRGADDFPAFCRRFAQIRGE